MTLAIVINALSRSAAASDGSSARARAARHRCDRRIGRACRARLLRLAAAVPHRLQELPALGEEARALVRVEDDLLHLLRDVARAEVELLVEALDRRVDLDRRDRRIAHRALLVAAVVDERVDDLVAVRLDEVVEVRAGVRRCERDLDRLAVHLLREVDGLADRLRRLAGEPHDERPVDQDAELVAVLGEAAGGADVDAFLDVLQDLVVRRLVADHEEAKAAVLHDLERLVVDVGAGVRRPGVAHLADAARDVAGALLVGGEGVVVEEDLAHAREHVPHRLDFPEHVRDAARAVAVPGRHLRPEAEGAAGRAAAAGVERDVRVLAVRRVVLLEVEVLGVDLGREGQIVQLLPVEQRPVRVRVDAAVAAVGDAGDGAPVATLRDLLHRDVELLAGDQVDRVRRVERELGLRGRLSADERDHGVPVPRLDLLRGLGVLPQRRRARVDDHEVVVRRDHDGFVLVQPFGRSVEQARARDHPGRVREPGRVPERPDLALRLVARPRAAIEVLVGRRVQKESLHHRFDIPLAHPCGGLPPPPAPRSSRSLTKRNTQTASRTRDYIVRSGEGNVAGGRVRDAGFWRGQSLVAVPLSRIRQCSRFGMASSEGVALIYAPEGVDPRAIFAGRPLIDRAIALAETAGLTPYVVGAADAPCPSGVDRVAPGGRLPVDLLPRTNVVLWRCDVAWVARTLQAVLRDGSGTRTVALDDRGRPAVVRLTATRLAGRVPATLELAAGGATAIGAPGQVAGNRLIALDAGGAGRFRAAEAELVATLDNPRDGVFDRVFNRPISRRVTPFLLSWPITPNQVTVLSLAVGLLAAVALAQSGYLWPIAGALLLQL